MSTLRCYHHSNCNDRPAVATCSRCGKGLCVECANKLRSRETGEILCTDCLNKELQQNAAMAVQARSKTKKEMIGMVVGFAIGLIFMIAVISAYVNHEEVGGFLFLGLFMPTLLASFGTIFKIAKSYGFFLGILLFFLMIIASPIIFLWRLIKRIKDMVFLKRYAKYQIELKHNIDKYFEAARAMHTGNDEEFEREVRAKYADMLKQNKQEAEKMIEEERQKRAAVEKELQEAAQSINKLNEEAKKSNMSGQLRNASKNPGKSTNVRETDTL